MSTTQHKSRTIIQSFEAKELKKRSYTTKLADQLTKYFGTVWFLVVNILFFLLWILINTEILPLITVFDPYPHVLLITMVSLEAIMLSVIVLISQNRENQIGTLRDELQLQVELITERQIGKIMDLVIKIAEKQGVRISDSELAEMNDNIDTGYIEKKLAEQLKDSGTNLIPNLPKVKVRTSSQNST